MSKQKAELSKELGLRAMATFVGQALWRLVSWAVSKNSL